MVSNFSTVRNLHHDYAPVHTSFPIRGFSTERNTVMTIFSTITVFTRHHTLWLFSLPKNGRKPWKNNDLRSLKIQRKICRIGSCQFKNWIVNCMPKMFRKMIARSFESPGTNVLVSKLEWYFIQKKKKKYRHVHIIINVKLILILNVKV